MDILPTSINRTTFMECDFISEQNVKDCLRNFIALMCGYSQMNFLHL